jgi:hypothetical protein
MVMLLLAGPVLNVGGSVLLAVLEQSLCLQMAGVGVFRTIEDYQTRELSVALRKSLFEKAQIIFER